MDLLEKSDMNNELFSAYYKAQKIVGEDEWNIFLNALKQPLPTTFRLAGSRQCVYSRPALKELHIVHG